MSLRLSTAFKQSRNIKRLGARYQSQLIKTEFEAEREAVKVHAAESAETWKKILIFVCIPAIVGTGYNANNLYQKHLEHMKEHPRVWIKYPYINMRAKDFFWGKNSLFFNPKANLDATKD